MHHCIGSNYAGIKQRFDSISPISDPATALRRQWCLRAARDTKRPRTSGTVYATGG